MRSIVRPRGVSTQAATAEGIEIVAMDEAVVDEHAVVAPPRMPSPAAPSTPASSEVETHIDPESKSPVRAPDEWRVEPIRIGVIERRTPKVARIVIGHIDHLRIGRLNVDDGLSGGVGSAHRLLRRGG